VGLIASAQQALPGWRKRRRERRLEKNRRLIKSKAARHTALLIALTLPASAAATQMKPAPSGGHSGSAASSGARAALIQSALGMGVNRTSHRERFVPGELLVALRPRSQAKRALNGRGVLVSSARRLSLPGVFRVRVKRRASVQGTARRLERSPAVRYAEPNFIRYLNAVPNDPGFPAQWALQNTGQTVLGYQGTPGADISAPEAWDQTTGSSSVIVAVVDDGVMNLQPDVGGNLWDSGDLPFNLVDEDGNGYVDDTWGWDFAQNQPWPQPGSVRGVTASHGTNVAGIIGAIGNNSVQIAGVNWNVSLMAVRIFDRHGRTTVAKIAKAFTYARDNGAKVVNASFGGAGSSQTEHDAIANAPGVLFVTAAANQSRSSDSHGDYPCKYSLANVICVGATDQDDDLASFSNYGTTSVDLGAPGRRVLTTYTAHGIVDDLFEDFDSETRSAWTKGGKGQSWGLSRRLRNRDGSLNLSIADSPRGHYRNRSNTWIRTPRLTLAKRQICLVAFYLYLRTEKSKDRLLVESSTGSGWTTDRAFSGRKNGPAFVLLPRDVTRDPHAFIRWRLRTNGSVKKDGAYVDDVGLSCLTSHETYGLNDGTSFAAPQVSGTAALIWAQTPGASVSEVRDAILGSVDTNPSLATKFVTGGRLDVAAATTP
jgi:subtilisin family serine protease